MFGFLKKLFGFGKQEDCSCCGKDEDPIVKLGPEPTPDPVGIVAQEVVKVIPEAIAVEQRPEVLASTPAAWPFPTAKPKQGQRKKRTLVKREEETKPAAPVQKKKKHAPKKSKPAAMTPSKNKKPAAK